MKLVMNPSARSGKGRKRWDPWLAALRKASIDLETVITTGAGDAREVARQTRGACTVVAVGGDGTINEVLDGILLSGNPELVMGVLYAGTSPDFCRFHNIPVDPQKALQTLLHGKIRAVDACRIQYLPSVDTTPVNAHFGCSCNIGLGATVAAFANRHRRWLGDTLGTGAGVMRAICTSKSVPCKLVLDNEILPITSFNHIAILKNPYIASGLKLDIDLQPTDGQLAVVAIHDSTPLGLCRIFPGFYTGRATASPAVFMRTGTSVRLEANTSQAVEFDGDPRGWLPIQIDLLPQALNLICGGVCNAKSFPDVPQLAKDGSPYPTPSAPTGRARRPRRAAEEGKRQEDT